MYIEAVVDQEIFNIIKQLEEENNIEIKIVWIKTTPESLKSQGTCMRSYRKAKTIRKQLQEIILQGNNEEIQNLFIEIVEVCRTEFREDNEPTLAGFLTENLYKAFITKDTHCKDHIRTAMINELKEPDNGTLKLVNTYKLSFKQIRRFVNLYEWSDGKKSYFSNNYDHPYFSPAEKYCLGNTLEEATINMEKNLRDYI